MESELKCKSPRAKNCEWVRVLNPRLLVFGIGRSNFGIERQKMSIDLLLKPTCGGCGSTTDLYGSNCKHMTLCLTCGKTMAENKAKCVDCGVTVTRLIRVRSMFPLSFTFFFVPCITCFCFFLFWIGIKFYWMTFYFAFSSFQCCD